MNPAMMELNPPTFSCPTHQQDLTHLVVQTLLEPPSQPHRPSSGSFSVIVTCPGNSPADRHNVTCEGTFILI